MVTSQAGHVSQGVHVEKELNKPPPAVIHHGLLPGLDSEERNTLPRTAGGIKPEILKTLWKKRLIQLHFQFAIINSFFLYPFVVVTLLH